MGAGKETGFVMYDDVNEPLSEEISSGGEDFLDIDTSSLEILEENKLDFEGKLDEDEFADLEFAQDFGDKTNDPVRMYLREMGTVPLLTREGEIELAKRIEHGQNSVAKALSRSTLMIRELLTLSEEIERGTKSARDVLIQADLMVSDEAVEAQTAELLASIAEIEKEN